MILSLWGSLTYSSTLILMLIFISVRSGKFRNGLLHDQALLVCYISITTILFTVIHKSSLLITNGNYSFLIKSNFQLFFFVMSVVLLIQILLVISITDVFYKMVLPGIINIFSNLSFLYIVGFGIISTVWFLIFTGIFCAFILVISIFDSLEPVIRNTEFIEDKNEKRIILDLVKEELNRYLKIGIQGILALGASVGVSMSILFKAGPDAWRNDEYLISAASMVFGFASVCLGVVIWIIKPYLENFTKVRYFYENNINNNKILLK